MTSRPSLQVRGVTLLELVVALAVMAVLSALAGLAWRTSDNSTQPSPGDVDTVALRRAAVASRVPMTRLVILGDSVRLVTAHPDGRILAGPALSGAVDGSDVRPDGARP